MKLKFGRIYLELDSTDPETPAMVYMNNQTASSTWDCATQAGVLSDY